MTRAWIILNLLVSLLSGGLLHAAEPGAAPKEPAMQPVVDNLALPRVLLIGDSISIGYTVPVREALKGKANVHRILTNGGTTTNGLANLDAWLGANQWDVIHFNFGLHDMKRNADATHWTPVEAYEKNLRELVARMKKHSPKAKLIWAATTPVPEGKLNPRRQPGDELKFNAIARRVMKDQQVAVNDLHALVTPRLGEFQLRANVHFNQEGYARLAGAVTAAIMDALIAKRP